MSRRRETIASEYFDALYQEKDDPWDFQTSRYERDKYDATLACLPRGRYARGFEAGCSIGVLTRRLADRCEMLVACDGSAVPLKHASERCSPCPHVSFMHAAIPDQWPPGHFDLIMLSEVLYYLAPLELARCAEKVAASLDREGDMIMVHYIGATDYPLSGDAAATLFGEGISPFARHMQSIRGSRYRIDVWRRA